MACIPVFILGQGYTSLPSLTVEQAVALAQIILCDEARRSGSVVRGGHPKTPIAGMFVSYSGTSSWRRGTDRVERIYAAVELLKHSGMTDKEATSEVAELLGTRIGNSKRGRPPKDGVPRDLVRSSQIVRSLCNRFKERHPWKDALQKYDPIVEKWFGYAVWLGSWSREFSRCNEAPSRQPKLEAVLSIAQEIFPWAKRLGVLCEKYLKWNGVPGGDEVTVIPQSCAPVLPKGWRPTAYFSAKRD